MAGFSLQDEERIDGRPEGIWTPYGPDVTEEEKAQGKLREAFKIRPLHPKDMNHFRKQATPKGKWKSNNQRDEEPDPDQYNAYLYDFLIESWEGLYEDNAHTRPAACTLENKLKMADKSLERANFIVIQASLFANDDAAREEAEKARFRGSREVPARQTTT
jgi:hypothetical protein